MRQADVWRMVRRRATGRRYLDAARLPHLPCQRHHQLNPKLLSVSHICRRCERPLQLCPHIDDGAVVGIEGQHRRRAVRKSGLGWVEIGQETFAPGFFVWNSEVGKRSLGVQTFWFPAVCANHIVWDATEVVEWTRKHTGNVHHGLATIREIIATLVQKRDQRKDGFVSAIRSAMRRRLGDATEECLKVLTRAGIPRSAAKQAVEYASSTTAVPSGLQQG